MTRPHHALRSVLDAFAPRLLLLMGVALVAPGCGSSPDAPGEQPGDDASMGEDDGGSWIDDGGGEPDLDGAEPDFDTGSSPGDGGAEAARPAVCGNGAFEDMELCDDGNTQDGDGCSADCKTVDPDYLCLTAGEACVRVVTCGNGVIEGNEACDDGEMTPDSGDGCSADCKTLEPGFNCLKPGQACVPSPVCGNGVRERGEQCDDGEATPESGDGCDASCQLESSAAWFCVPGSPCIALVCGDGNRTPNEECDDGQNPPLPGDGCDANCRLEPGFRCGASGCRPICGDGLLKGDEQCDDSDLVSGDGCSAACKKEPFFSCPPTAGDCTSTIVCGDGCVDPGEICDPGNLGNKCGQADASCTSTAQDPARACKSFAIVTDPGRCGDGTVNLNEECDPACPSSTSCNIPGCTACDIVDGWACPRAGYCYQIPACGDGVIQLGEECDPGPSSTPGCDPTQCRIATDYYCSGEPSVCVRSRCGDGFVAPDEQCDDGPGTVPAPGTPVGGDGCSATCTVEPGYVCPPNLRCRPICGDGVLQPGEECEETSAGCANCFIKPGYTCNASGKSCVLTKCGTANGAATPVVERGEGCDDGNAIAGDTCSPTCQREPVYTHDNTGKPINSSPSCGDGFKTQSEGCDDGNRTDGDGCSSACVEESGWECTENTITYPPYIDFRVTLRDFKARADSGGHPHFKRNNEIPSGTDWGIPGQLCSMTNYSMTPATPGASDCGVLDANGKPRLVKTSPVTIPDYRSAFSLWYADGNTTLTGTNGVINVLPNPGPVASPSTVTRDVLRLTRDGTTSAYTFPPKGESSANFFKLDGRGYGTTPGQSHNYNFTTELRYFFQYRGGEVLTFEGDDDVWVYVNGRLAVDVGGIHCPQVGRVILGDEDGSCNLQVTDNGSCTTPSFSNCTTYSATEQGKNTDGRFGLTKGEVYEIVLFHAERNPTGSNFRLTLDGFLAPRSTCTTRCGDGIRAGNEICDTNSGQSSGYNVCLNNCTINFCGDGKVQAPQETCDAAVKVTYQQAPGGCGFDCRPAPYCGDGKIQAFAGEVCDDGKNDGSYGSCTSNCKGFGGYCGDGVKQPQEDCDAPTKVAYQADGKGCGFDCKWAPGCGDGTRNGPETCEPPGTAQCDAQCQIQPFCGDGILSPGETCDYGSFNAPPASVEYGGCDTACKQGPHCGDTMVQSAAGEECDQGANNSPASNPAYDSCTTACLNGPRCGDGIVQPTYEACDNGFNEDTYAFSSDACGPGCTAVPRCGDGIVHAAVEQCDDGPANSDGAYDGCRSDCFWGPYCGDGIQNGSEECDDPNGNVAYARDGKGCSYECKRNVPYCGDGVRNGPEQCDDGEGKNTGAYGGCNADCTRAAHCGDGVVQADNERCDDGPSGSPRCTQSCMDRVILL